MKPVTDRLSSTLFVAALFHGLVILGVTFTGSDGDTAAIPTLRVTLLADSDAPDTDSVDADYLAQRGSAGGGRRTPGERPTTTPHAAQRVGTLPEPGGTAPAPRAAAARIPSPSSRTLAVQLDRLATLPAAQREDSLASPATRASVLAAYLDAWRRRVERVGTANFPAAARAAPANPTLEVTLGPDGALEAVVVRRSSGNPALDQAAVDILHLAVPFDPLPPAVRAEYGGLRFAYEWDFRGDAQSPGFD